MIVRLAGIVLLVAVNAFFACVQLALIRARRPRLEAMARNGDRLARWALRAMAAGDRSRAASQLGVTVASLGLGWLLADALRAAPLLPVGGAAGLIIRAVIAVTVVAFLHVVFGELMPRAAALARPEQLARVLAPPLVVLSWVVAPVATLLHHSARVLTRRLRGSAPTDEERPYSPEELRLLVERSGRRGALAPSDAELLEGVFEFSEKNARAVMTPRTEIVALPIDAALPDVVTVVAEAGLSRYPVYDGSIDNIVGIVLAKDLIPILARGRRDGGVGDAAFSLRATLRDVHFVPGTREVEHVLADFKRLKEHMAVVLDEYGGTAGLVTMEDLLEEIVGEILDEYDEAPPPLASPRAGEALVPGDTNIGELNERFGLSVSDADFTTIGGFVFGSLGRVPQVGDRVAAGGALFTVRAVEERRATMIAVRVQGIGNGE